MGCCSSPIARQAYLASTNPQVNPNQNRAAKAHVPFTKRQTGMCVEHFPGRDGIHWHALCQKGQGSPVIKRPAALGRDQLPPCAMTGVQSADGQADALLPQWSNCRFRTLHEHPWAQRQTERECAVLITDPLESKP